jgi:amidohydrolase
MTVMNDKLITFRRELHTNPEVSGNEKKTAARVIKFLKQYKPDVLLTNVGGHGIVATWDSQKKGKELLFRAELDALPIEEINSFEHKSTSAGVSHKCGHDGHTTILCGLAKWISENKPTSGKIYLLFQPAEENGEGAKAVLADKRFESINPDYVFALHNLPGFPLHQVVLKQDSFTTAVTSLIINLKGKTSHAAEPEHGLNPALAVAEIIQKSLALENNNPDTDELRVITPVFIELGEKAYGVSAGKASIHFTIRCWDNINLEKLQNEIEVLSEKIATNQKLKIEFSNTQTFQANINDSKAVEFVQKAAESAGLEIKLRNYPFKWGEDFGLFTTKFNGCMFGLGAGEETPALHNPDYDFPDEITKTGIQIFSNIIKEISR